MNIKTKLLLVDDHELVRMGLSTLLEAEGDLEVVAQAGSVTEALACLKTHDVDVAVVDIAMPGGNGLTLLERIVQEYPGVKTVMLSMYDDERYVVKALRGGACGYAFKGEGATSVIEAARAAMAGKRYLSPSLTQAVIDGYLKTVGQRLDAGDEASSVLTEREKDVLRLLCGGAPKAQVAKQLFISIRTVETHRANAMRKLDLHSQTDLVRYAIRSGLISADDGAPGT